MFKSFMHDERGSSAIEMMLVLAVMAVVMVGIFTFGKSFIIGTADNLNEKIVELNTPTDTNTNTNKDEINTTTNTTTTTNKNTTDNTNNTTNGSINNDSIEDKLEKEYYVE